MSVWAIGIDRIRPNVRKRRYSGRLPFALSRDVVMNESPSLPPDGMNFVGG